MRPVRFHRGVWWACVIWSGAGLLRVSAACGMEGAAFYDPVEKEVEGWTVAVDPRLLEPEHRVLADRVFQALGNHLQRVTYILPEDRVDELRQLRLWIELDNAQLTSMQYHPDRRWLESHGHDPRLVKHVHIPHAAALVERGTWAKHPYVILHELAHAYHDQVLSFDHPQILETYQLARDSGIYEKVLVFDGRHAAHYALTNHKEYFAELTESYLGVNDFYPFVRAELQEYDPRGYELMQSIWGPVD